MAEEKISNETTSEEVKDTNQETADNSAQTEHAAEEKSDKKKKGKKDKHEVEMEELTAKLDDMKDRHLRLQAEFDNFRKRTLKEKADLIKSGGETVLVNILPVIDDFERAIDSMKEVADEDAGKQGTLLIYNKFKDFLKQNNVKEIEAQNEVFDVDLHEAITKIPAPSKELKGKVVDVIQKGYCLNEKVIRFAKVVIGE